VSHSAVIDWAMDLGQKYVRVQLSRRLITTDWEHIDCVQKDSH